jgi:hypothetical protein
MIRLKYRRAAILAALAAHVLIAPRAIAGSALLYSWENGLEDWTAANATITNSSTFGVTDGAQSLLIDNLKSGFKNDAGVATVGSGTVYNNWGQAGTRIAAGDADVKLEFDFSWDNSNVTGTPAFGQLGMFVNSTTVGFKQYGTGALIGGNVGADFPALAASAAAEGVTMTSVGPNTVHLAIPMGPTKSLNISAPSAGSFYQVGFKANGGWGGTVDWAVDNMQVTGANIPIPEPSAILMTSLLGLAFVCVRRSR